MATTLLYITHSHEIVDILSCHVYKGIHYHYTQNDRESGEFEQKPKQYLGKKIEKNVNIRFGDSKGQSALMMTFDPNSMGYSF